MILFDLCFGGSGSAAPAGRRTSCAGRGVGSRSRVFEQLVGSDHFIVIEIAAPQDRLGPLQFGSESRRSPSASRIEKIAVPLTPGASRTSSAGA